MIDGRRTAHRILNIAAGPLGRSGDGIDDDIFPQRMLVDSVRVYQRTDGEKDDWTGAG